VKLRIWIVAALALTMLPAGALAASSLSIRLVEASNKGSGASAGLKDVAGILKGSLAFSNYSLLGSCAMKLPASGDKGTVGGYEVTCRGGAQSLSITVVRDGKVMLTTQVRMEDGAPLILGGFPGGAGRHVLVFTVR
jgi:hypothetical protein